MHMAVDTAPLERKPIVGPDFICFGQAKAGTRWLYDQMKSRPDVWMPPIKEMNFFVGSALKPVNLRKIRKLEKRNDPFVSMFAEYRNHGPSRAYIRLRRFPFTSAVFDFRNRVGDIGWYKGLFQFKGDRVSGDVSPSYSQLDERDIAGLAKELSETKFVFLLREPVSRLWSAICMDVRKTRIDASRLQDLAYVKSLAKRKQNNSLPSVIWDRWRRHIPEERMGFWFLEDIKERPGEVVDEICQLIGAKAGPGGLPAGYNSKADNAKVPMDPKVRAYLVDHFREEHDRCAQLFGGHALSWRETAKR